MNVDERTSCREIPCCAGGCCDIFCWNALGTRITVFENYTQLECMSINDYDERNCNCFITNIEGTSVIPVGSLGSSITEFRLSNSSGRMD